MNDLSTQRPMKKGELSRSRKLVFAAVAAAAANLLSYPPLSIPISVPPFESSIHFFQLPIFICAILAGPLAGTMAGAVGGAFMAFTRIPFIVGGMAILGLACAIFRRKLRPFLAGIFAWVVQAPYVVVTDYIWFTWAVGMPSGVAWTVIYPILIKLTIEAIISSTLADVIVGRIAPVLGVSR